MASLGKSKISSYALSEFVDLMYYVNRADDSFACLKEIDVNRLPTKKKKKKKTSASPLHAKLRK